LDGLALPHSRTRGLTGREAAWAHLGGYGAAGLRRVFLYFDRIWEVVPLQQKLVAESL